MLKSEKQLQESIYRPVPDDWDLLILEALLRVVNVGDEDTFESFKDHIAEDVVEELFKDKLITIETAHEGHQFVALTEKGGKIVHAARRAVAGLI